QSPRTWSESLGLVFKRISVALGIVVVFLSLAGQWLAGQEPPPTAAVSGLVRTTGGVPVPGATLRLTEISSGRAWVSWTDENGKFNLPGLPLGHYRAEVAQLGFASATKEFDLAAQN